MIIGIDIRNIGKKRTGDETVFFNLVKELSKIDRKNEYWLFTDTDPVQDPALQASIGKLNLGDNFKVIALAKKGCGKFIWNIWKLPRYLRSHKIHIYHTQYLLPFFIPKRVKLITTVHDVSFKVFPELVRKIDRLLLGMLLPFSLARADKIIAVSKFTAKEIPKYFSVDPAKITWIHNGVSRTPELVEIDSEKTRRTIEKFGLPEKFIFYIGTMQPRKNLPILIQAFFDLNKIFPEMKLVLAGKKGYNFDKKIDEKISELEISEKIVFPGYIDEAEKQSFFRLASIFCLPSVYEGFGIPIIEAMAAQNPVIASNIPAHLEVGGDACLFFEKDSYRDLAKKLENVMKNGYVREELVKKGLIQAKKFSWETGAKKLLALYENLGKSN